MRWRSQLDLEHPCWAGYRSLLRVLPGDRFPDAADLNPLLPPAALSAFGRPVRFVRAGRLPPGNYETRIGRTGEVSTREHDLHDLFNALAWARFPRIKSALNALHLRHVADGGPHRRGAVRDAVTLFDEGGAILMAARQEDLQAVAEQRWAEVYQGEPGWARRYRLALVGHGLLEKLRAPYPAITANTLLLQVPESMLQLSETALTGPLDRAVAGMALRGSALAAPRGLSPLPLMGIPGWWEPQDEAFYRDRSVFRPLPAGREPAPVWSLDGPQAAALTATRGES